MTLIKLPVLLTAILVGTATAAVELDKLNTSIESLQGYEYGNRQGVDLRWVEAQVGMASADDSVRGQVETKLIEALAKAKTADAKQFLCRQLRTIGTARCVPQLAALLNDPELSHMARYALGRIDAPEAGKALHKALGTTSGTTKVGIINTLVQMGYAPAASDLVKLVGDADENVSLAAIRATGRFGGVEDVKMLHKRRTSGTANVPVDSAILNCAARFAARGDVKPAAEIYEHYLTGEYPEHLRTAGLRGLITTAGIDGKTLLVRVIKGDDAALRRNAIAMMALIEGEETTATLVELCGVAAPDGQELIVRSLAARGDQTATPAIIGLLKSEHETVRVAALEALGEIGTTEAIPYLAALAAHGSSAEKRIARASLVGIRGPGISDALIRTLGSAKTPSRLEVIKAVGQRTDREPFETLRKIATTDEDATLRREAMISMGRIETEKALDALLRIIFAPKATDDRPAAERAIQLVFNRLDDKETQAHALLAGLANAPDDAKPVILGLLATPATDRAYTAVSAAVKSPNDAVRNAAIRALCKWPNPAPIKQLYEIATRSRNESHQAMALRGFIELAPVAPDPTACFVKALELAKGDDDIRRILRGLHHAGTRKALEIAVKYMSHEGLKSEAYRATVKVAGVYCWEDPANVRILLDKIIANAPDDNIRNEARRVIERMDKYKGVIVTWKGTGAFTQPGIADGDRVFDTVFEPEKDFDSKDIAWRIVLPEFEGGGKIDLEKTYGDIDFCCAYLRTTVISPVDQEAKLQWRVDDRIKGWLNGEPTNDGTIKLRKGANPFIIKVGDHGGGWSFECKIVKPDDSPLEGLRFER